MSEREPYPVWVDGGFRAPLAPAIAAEDAGFQLGLAVFETLLWEGGCLYFVERHLARLERGARELSIPWPPPHDPAAALAAFCERLGARDAAIRVTLTRGVPGRGATFVIGARDIVRVADPGARLMVSRWTKRHDDPLEAVKSTNRLRNVLAREEALARGAWDALIPTEEGDLSEGTFCNLFVLSGGRLLTPDESRGCLGGVMRETLLAELAARPVGVPVELGRVELADVRAAREVFATNTTGRVVPIVAVDGLAGPLAAGLPGSAGELWVALRSCISSAEARYKASRGAR